jgi:hypothetical protein
LGKRRSTPITDYTRKNEVVTLPNGFDIVDVVRPHWGLGKSQTPAMAMVYVERPITTLELYPLEVFKIPSRGWAVSYHQNNRF